MTDQSAAYFEAVQHGPFPGLVDPWAEDARYFHQLHGSIIGFMVEQLQDSLLQLGYQAGRETSLQIIENRIQSDAVFIYHNVTKNLVTISELVSPMAKNGDEAITTYRHSRDDILSKGVNIVEIDITRSRSQLIIHPPPTFNAYHYAVSLPEQPARYIGCDFLTPLKRVAIPLREQVVPLDPQPTYDAAYRQVLLAGHILRETEYEADYLPQPSLISVPQRRFAQEQVKMWKARLEEMQ
jgi:hypothetical protein